MKDVRTEPASFRDPAGFIVHSGDRLLRVVTETGRPDFQELITSGLYEELVGANLLVSHEELDLAGGAPPNAWRLLQPRRIPFVSYPYEWPFSALRDAALLTLDVQRRALARGMTLKDASAFNVQFEGTQPVFIDTTSFTRRGPGAWRAYRQFCRHFLAPLALAARVHDSLPQILRIHLDGIPLPLASRLLPRSTWLRPGLLLHLHLHSQAERRLTRRARPSRNERNVNVEALVDSLYRTIEALQGQPRSHWTAYDEEQPSYVPDALADKTRLVERWLQELSPATVWDMGANTGRFAARAASQGARVIAFDQDPACVERIYRDARRSGLPILPLVMDLTQPSPAIGWAHEERAPLAARGPADVVLALALVHHVAIAGNVPLPHFARYLARLGRHAIVEFVPKDDPMVQRLLASRDDTFPHYSLESFRSALEPAFIVRDVVPLQHSRRTLLLLQTR